MTERPVEDSVSDVVSDILVIYQLFSVNFFLTFFKKILW